MESCCSTIGFDSWEGSDGLDYVKTCHYFGLQVAANWTLLASNQSAVSGSVGVNLPSLFADYCRSIQAIDGQRRRSFVDD